MQIILESLLSWFAPILSFTTEEIYRLVNKERDGSIHLQKFFKYPKNWKNEELNERWIKLKKIREISNISIENMRSEKTIGSSLEADIKIKLNKKFYDNYKKFDFSEICITSSASVVLNKSSDKEMTSNIKTVSNDEEDDAKSLSKSFISG